MASDSDSSDDTLMSQALPTTKIPDNFDPSFPPASAEEYLQHVVWEARNCQEVVTVNVDRQKLKKPGNIIKKLVKATAPQGYAPSSETQQELLAAFSKLRSQITNLRTSKQIPPSPVPLRGLQNLLEWHAQWLEVLGFSEAQGRWFYALLACLEKPLTPESCSQIRDIASMCVQIRSSLTSSDHPHLPHLNVIICIVARYFNQEDLADG
ncbi:gem-associated protein 2 isoform X2 [Panulirus ornatus]|uniref:gem-associated protein 2 isoform X2 n=1 Tax=Panulirus ornatus TaxID=150431 RepID=UPI003A85E0DE